MAARSWSSRISRCATVAADEYAKQYSDRCSRLRDGAIHHLDRPVDHARPCQGREPRPWRLRHDRRRTGVLCRSFCWSALWRGRSRGNSGRCPAHMATRAPAVPPDLHAAAAAAGPDDHRHYFLHYRVDQFCLRSNGQIDPAASAAFGAGRYRHFARCPRKGSSSLRAAPRWRSACGI